ncbi:MAG: hypothetical protein IJW70_06750 [Clostridia bacterium]|nr:hypothetical protein [Clostridia bacterium]
MFCIKVADVCVEIDNRYCLVEDVCRDYIVKGECVPAFRVQISSDEVHRMLSGATWNLTAPMAESYLINRALCRKMAEYDAYLFHSSVITYRGKCIAFSGKRGTGKSTHTALWREKLGKEVTVINGDKPLLALRNGELIAYGTPWCGKEGWQTNTSARLDAVVFLEQAKINAINPIDKQTFTHKISEQILPPANRDTADKFVELLHHTVEHVPAYVLSCNMSTAAVDTVIGELYHL